MTNKIIILVEDQSSGKSLIQEFSDLYRIKAIKPKNSKRKRIEYAQNILKEKRLEVFFPKDASFMKDYLESEIFEPFKSKNNDSIDSIAQFLIYYEENKNEINKELNIKFSIF